MSQTCRYSACLQPTDAGDAFDETDCGVEVHVAVGVAVPVTIGVAVSIGVSLADDNDAIGVDIACGLSAIDGVAGVGVVEHPTINTIEIMTTKSEAILLLLDIWSL